MPCNLSSCRESLCHKLAEQLCCLWAGYRGVTKYYSATWKLIFCDFISMMFYAFNFSCWLHFDFFSQISAAVSGNGDGQAAARKWLMCKGYQLGLCKRPSQECSYAHHVDELDPVSIYL